MFRGRRRFGGVRHVIHHHVGRGGRRRFGRRRRSRGVGGMRVGYRF